MAARLLLCHIVLVLLGGATAADGDATGFYSADDDVADMTPEQLMTEVMTSTQGWFVEFYAPWCGHCQKLVPDYKKAATALKDYIKFGAVDVDKHKSIASTFGVKGFPALKMFSKPGVMNPYTHKPYREAEDYTGARNYKGIKTFALNKMPSLVVTVEEGDSSDSTLPAIVTKATSSNQNIIALFTSKSKTPPLFKWLSTEFADRILFAEIHKDRKELVSKFEVESYPTVKVLKFDEGKSDYTIETFEGDMVKAELVAFVEKFAKEKDESVGFSAVQKITAMNMDKVVMKTKDAWLVSYFTDKQPEELEKLGEDYQKHGIVRVGAINCTAEVELCNDQEKGLKPGGFGVFGYGEEKKLEEAWTLDEAKEAVLDSIPNRVMIIPVASQLQGFLMQAQQQKMIPLLLLSKKDDPAPMIKAVALAFEKSVLVGLLPQPDDATKKQFQVKKLPALVSMFAVPDPNAKSKQEELQFQLAHFDKKMFGGFSYAAIAMWSQALVQKIYPEKAGQARDEAAEAAADSEAPDTDGLPFVTAANWQSLCLSKSLCAIGFLDGFPAEEQPEKLSKELEMLNSAKAKAKKRKDPFTFMWADGLCQEAFADAFDVQPLKLPTIVVFAPKKSRYASFVGALNEEALKDFLAGVTSGRIGTRPMSAPPAPIDIDCSAFKRDGGAEEAAAVEDDTDMDDMMAEILADEKRAAEEREAEAKREKEEAEAKKAAEAKRKLEEAAAAKKAKKAKKKKKKKKKKSKKKSEL